MLRFKVPVKTNKKHDYRYTDERCAEGFPQMSEFGLRVVGGG